MGILRLQVRFGLVTGKGGGELDALTRVEKLRTARIGKSALEWLGLFDAASEVERAIAEELEEMYLEGSSSDVEQKVLRAYVDSDNKGVAAALVGMSRPTFDAYLKFSCKEIDRGVERMIRDGS